MGNILDYRQPTATPPPLTIATILDSSVIFRPRHCSDDKTVVDLHWDDSFSAACAIDSFNSFDTEIGSITILNPNRFSSFICEFTSLSTRSIDFHKTMTQYCIPESTIDLMTDLVCFLNTMLQENKRSEREIYYTKKLKLICGFLFAGIVVCMLMHAMIVACWFNNFSNVVNVGIMGLLFARIGYFVDRFLGSRIRILNAKQEVVVDISMSTRMILEGNDCVLKKRFKNLGLVKDIRNARKRIFEKWKQLIHLEDD